MADPKRPAKKPAAEAAVKKAVKKAAPRKKAAARPRQTAAQKLAAEQERALVWAVQYGAPIGVLEGWDPDTGEWTTDSPVGRLLERVGKGSHVTTAAKAQRFHRITEMQAKGRQYLQDDTVSEDRMLIPIEVRPFVDLVNQIDMAEAETEMSAVELVYAAIKKDPRIGLTFLSRRFPDRWAEQQLLHLHEYDPRDAAVSELMSDPNVSSQLAAFARRAEAAAAGRDEPD